MGEFTPNSAYTGLNLDSIPSQIPQGSFTYALNAQIEGFDGNIVTVQNEQGNQLCVTIPAGYKVIGLKNLIQESRIFFWITNPLTKKSQIGYAYYNNCTYIPLIDDKDSDCSFDFDIAYPIHKVIVKTTNCSTQLYWTDDLNPRRYIDLDDLPWVETIDPNNDFKRIKVEGKLDCNKLNVQPNFSIPTIDGLEVTVGGSLTMGVYQFAVQYSNSTSEQLSKFFNVSNPISIFEQTESEIFDKQTSKAITVRVNNLDTTGLYEFFNLAVIKTVNNITSVEHIGNFPITDSTYTYTYTGTTTTQIRLNIEDIFQQYPYYDIAGDIFEVDNVLGWGILKEQEDINYQKFWANVKLEWETYRIPYNQFEGYTNGINTEKYKGYFRDEIYPYEGLFILKNGKQTKSFHIPGRIATPYDRDIIDISNKDNAFSTASKCDPAVPKERWQVYNTGSLTGYSRNFCQNPATTPPPQPPVTNQQQLVKGTVEVICNDNNCQEQGNMQLRFTFESALQHPTQLRIGDIVHDVPDNIDYYGGNGEDNEIFTPPSGAVQRTAWDAANFGPRIKPWVIALPSGASMYDNGPNGFIFFENAQQNPNLPHVVYGSWTCHSCGTPTTDLYIKSSNPLVKFQLTAVNPGVTIHNVVNDPEPVEEPQAPEIPDPVIPPSNQDCIKYDDCYIGPYQYGEFGYWESTERYPNNEVIWGDLRNKPIRHHKFPDLLVAPIHDNNITNVESFEHSIFPIGVRINVESLYQSLVANLSPQQVSQIAEFRIVRGNRVNNKSVIAKGLMHNVGKTTYQEREYLYTNYPLNDLRPDPYYVSEKLDNHDGFVPSKSINGFATETSHRTYTFHSPDTHFYDPYLNNTGQYLKIETIEHGVSTGHFVKVRKNAEYKFLTKKTVYAAAGLGLASGVTIAAGMFGWPTFSMAPVAPTYTAATELFEKLAPFTNFGYSFNQVGTYSNSYPIPNSGDKQRSIDYNKYIISGVNNVEEGRLLNNIKRESAVYISTNDGLPFSHEYDASIPEDKSRYNLASIGDNLPPETFRKAPISSYYASIKRNIINQWGRIYSYETIDTGYNHDLFNSKGERFKEFPTVFGGDIFINRFAYKSKLPFFRDNTVNEANQTDVMYDEDGTLNYPMFWISTKPSRFDIDIEDEVDKLADEFFEPGFFKILSNILLGGAPGSIKAMNLIRKLFSEIHDKIGTKNINLDRPDITGLYERGLHYLFAYGIPYFFCESEINVDYRQATNAREGNFYPNVGGAIPDDWLQETNVTITLDNIYHYNKSYSKQNKETYFSHLKESWDPTKKCATEFPNRAIWSDQSSVEESRNNWLIYRPVAKKDFTKSYGALIALDGIENRQVLVRFENRTQLYNALLTAPTSAADVYLGQELFASNVPPIDYGDSELGYIGSQNKYICKSEFGHIIIDAKRGGVFLINSQKVDVLSDINTSAFFSNELPFKILDTFPEYPIDNHLNGIGVHGVFDSEFKRFILTKLDYKVVDSRVRLLNNKFYVEGKEVQFTDSQYFCNQSFTISFSFKTKSWTSFHSYLPNFYAGSTDCFYSGNNSNNTTVWRHNTSPTRYNNFYGVKHSYIIEYPFAYKTEDEILQGVKDYTKVNKYLDKVRFVQSNDVYFTKSEIYNDQQYSGEMILVHKPKNNLSSYLKYPKFNSNNREILFTKTDNYYTYNGIHDVVKDYNEPIFKESCESVSEKKIADITNLDYSIRSFKKYQIRGKDCKIRHTLDHTDEYRFISQFILTETQKSYK